MVHSYSIISNILAIMYFCPTAVCASDNNGTAPKQTWSDKVMFWYMRNNINQESLSSMSSLSPKTRVKRQGSAGAGKFTEAAAMSQTRVLQMWMQNFKNMFSSAHIGGSHPLHKDVPKPFVGLFKQSVMAFLFPKVGDDKHGA